MSGPFIYIGTFTVRSGKLEETKEALTKLAALVEANEPRLISFTVFLDEQGSKVSVVQLHPDSESMEFHMSVISEHMAGVFDYLESTVSEQTYGRPSESLARTLEQWAEPGVPVTAMPVVHAGFTRSAAG